MDKTSRRRLSLQQSENRLNINAKDEELGAKSNDEGEGDLDSETVLRVAAHSDYGHKVEEKEALKRRSTSSNRKSIEITPTDSQKRFSNVASEPESPIEYQMNPAKGIKRYSDV